MVSLRRWNKSGLSLFWIRNKKNYSCVIWETQLQIVLDVRTVTFMYCAL